MFRSIASRILPSLEKDLSRSIGKEVHSMDAFGCMMAESQVYSFQPAASAVARGAFGRTSIDQAPAKLVRVERCATNKGLFHE
mmetsp:Transcript_52631/g.63366  ORF Transcript_52631/g.63366 Transcript_52631/m.63366 type:complete len:83 (+) Transcript_52631:106-354(+)